MRRPTTMLWMYCLIYVLRQSFDWDGSSSSIDTSEVLNIDWRNLDPVVKSFLPRSCFSPWIETRLFQCDSSRKNNTSHTFWSKDNRYHCLKNVADLIRFRARILFVESTHFDTTAVVSSSLGLGPKNLNIEINISSGKVSAAIAFDFCFWGRSQINSWNSFSIWSPFLLREGWTKLWIKLGSFSSSSSVNLLKRLCKLRSDLHPKL